jgi:hypothetical protein
VALVHGLDAFIVEELAAMWVAIGASWVVVIIASSKGSGHDEPHGLAGGLGVTRRAWLAVTSLASLLTGLGAGWGALHAGLAPPWAAVVCATVAGVVAGGLIALGNVVV